MKKMILATITAAVLSIPTLGQSCDSIGASFSGGWRQIESAPRDGSVVEIMQTYGIAPWYGLFKWTKEMDIPNEKGTLTHTTLSSPEWVNVNEPGHSVQEACAFWRPYKPVGPAYTDPTGGAQKSIAYWCAAMHRPYDKKTDSCK